MQHIVCNQCDAPTAHILARTQFKVPESFSSVFSYDEFGMY